MLGLSAGQNVQYAAMSDNPDQIEMEVQGYVEGIPVNSDFDLWKVRSKVENVDCLRNVLVCLERVDSCWCSRAMVERMECISLNAKRVLSSSLITGAASVAAGIGTVPPSVPILSVSVPVAILSTLFAWYWNSHDPEPDCRTSCFLNCFAGGFCYLVTWGVLYGRMNS